MQSHARTRGAKHARAPPARYRREVASDGMHAVEGGGQAEALIDGQGRMLLREMPARTCRPDGQRGAAAVPYRCRCCAAHGEVHGNAHRVYMRPPALLMMNRVRQPTGMPAPAPAAQTGAYFNTTTLPAGMTTRLVALRWPALQRLAQAT